MYYQPEIMLEQYDLEIKQITKGRGAFLCDTQEGKKILMPFRGSMERAEFVQHILKRLKEKGYPAEQICRTKEDTCIVTDESGIRFWLKEYREGSECQTTREYDMLDAAGAIAVFHRQAAGCADEIPAFMHSEKNAPPVLYRRHYRELIQIKNYVHARKKKNEFERYFWEQYPHFIAQAKEAVTLLEHTDPQKSVCGFYHGDCNQHNIIRTADGVLLINFENMCYGEPVVDLANFLRKVMEKNNWNTDLGKRILMAYKKERKLLESERQLLYMLLLFPEKFWKITNHYSNSHKAWVSGRDIEKLQKLIRAEHARVQFLENVFSFL